MRKAFTFIELVVTIIILGFVFSGFPILFMQDAKLKEAGIAQEAILAATTKMSQIFSYKWDERSNDGNTSISASKVLDVPTGDNELLRSTGKFRVGHFINTGRRSFHSLATNASTLGNDAGDTGIDDIDDNHSNQLVTAASAGTGYKKDYTLTITTNYISDNYDYNLTTINNVEFENASLNPTNIKRIQVNVIGNDGQIGSTTTLFTFTSYSSNIGETEIASRVFN